MRNTERDLVIVAQVLSGRSMSSVAAEPGLERSTVRAIQDSCFELDVYLWELYDRPPDFRSAPHSRLARYYALAQCPLPRPTPAEVGAFDAECDVARERFIRLRKKAGLCCKPNKGVRWLSREGGRLMILRWPDGSAAALWPQSERTVLRRRPARRSSLRR